MKPGPHPKFQVSSKCTELVDVPSAYPVLLQENVALSMIPTVQIGGSSL